MATYQEIFTQTATEITQEPVDRQTLVDSLKTYFNSFHDVFVIGDTYLRNGLPFFTQGQVTLNQFKNQMHNKIENKLTCGFEINLTPNDVLKVRFVLQNGINPAVRIQLVKSGNTRSDEFTNQEQAAAVLAKIVLKYKD